MARVMIGRLGVAAAAALAPAAWGTTYLVTTELLPDGRPMFLAAMRALPAGLLLLLVGRRLPHGVWWGRAAVLGMLNIGLFFPLIFSGAYHLPGGVAATIGSMQPLAVAGFAALLLAVRPTRRTLLAGLAGVAGVALLVLKANARLDGLGIAAMLGALLIMALGIVLARRWGHPEGTTMLDVTAWQLVIGGVFLVPLAALTEGKPPSLTTSNTVGFLYLGLFGTALAYVLWFRGIERLGAGPVSFLSLVNPAVATIGGILVLQQNLTILQALGLFLALGAMFVGQAAPKTTTIAEPPVPVDPVPGWAVPADPVPGKGGSPIPAIGREFRE